jgi:glycosyltransferase involved in cell wall biosynthesis
VSTGRRVLVAHPSTELYGSDRVAAESVAAFAGAGWEVVAALPGTGPLTAVLEGLGARVVVVPAPVLRKALMSPRGLVTFGAAMARATLPMRRLLREVRPDVVYVSTVTVPGWLALGRGSGARVVCHVHEAEEALPRPVRLALAAPLLLAHDVIANSEASRAVLLEDLPVLRRRSRVVYNGVPGPGRAGPPRAALTGPIRLTLVGRVSPRKGTDVAVQALARLRSAGVDATLTLVGGVFPGYEWFERQVRAQAAAAGLTGHVTWAGVLPSVWDALAAADVALVPSRVEPFGNAAVEAILACRPVVAGDTQGLREIVRPGVDGELAAPGDAGALADAVMRIVRDWPAAIARAEAARDRAASRFAPERYRRDLAELIGAAPRRHAAAGPEGSGTPRAGAAGTISGTTPHEGRR